YLHGDNAHMAVIGHAVDRLVCLIRQSLAIVLCLGYVEGVSAGLCKGKDTVECECFRVVLRTHLRHSVCAFKCRSFVCAGSLIGNRTPVCTIFHAALCQSKSKGFILKTVTSFDDLGSLKGCCAFDLTGVGVI